MDSGKLGDFKGDLDSGELDLSELKDYPRLSPEDLEIFLRLPVSKEFRVNLYQKITNAATEDRCSGICCPSDEKEKTSSDACPERGG